MIVLSSVNARGVILVLLTFCCSLSLDAAERIRPQVYQRIVEIQQLLNPVAKENTHSVKGEAESHGVVDRIKVQSLLDQLLQMKLNNYEQALALQFSGGIAVMQEDYGTAYQLYFQVWQLQSLPDIQQINLEKTLAQLAMNRAQTDDQVTGQETVPVQAQSIPQWQIGVNHLLSWMNAVQAYNQQAKSEQQVAITEQDYYLLAQGYAHVAQWSHAAEAIETAIEQSEARQKKVAPENWYRLNLIACLKQNTKSSNQAAIAVLKVMVKYYPQMRYWRQLASLYQQTDEYALALTALHMAYLEGVMTKPHDIKWLAQLMMQQKNYYQSADILRQAVNDQLLPADISNLTQQADAWLMAREYVQAKSVLVQLASLSQKKQIQEKIKYVDTMIAARQLL